MKLTFETLPTISIRDVSRRSRPASLGRRAFVRQVSVGLSTLAFAYLSFWDIKQAIAADDGKYYREWKNTKTGPCSSYASNHTEDGLKCGPSYASSTYCWTESSTTSGEAKANTGNQRGWHKWGWGHGQTYYLQRPDQCWSSSSGSDYDSWRWVFSDGVTYGCSDGWVCHLAVGWYMKTICPYPR